MVVFGQSGCIWQKLLYSGKLVDLGKNWLYLGKIFCIWVKLLYFCKTVCIWAKWLYLGKVVVYEQK